MSVFPSIVINCMTVTGLRLSIRNVLTTKNRMMLANVGTN
jgi:hypothetical protein